MGGGTEGGAEQEVEWRKVGKRAVGVSRAVDGKTMRGEKEGGNGKWGCYAVGGKREQDGQGAR